MGEFPDMTGRKAQLCQQFLPKGAVIFQPVAPGGPANHSISLDPQGILPLAITLRHAFEQDKALAADPFEGGFPIVDLRDEAAHRAARFGFGNHDPDLMALGDQAAIERAQIAGFRKAEDSHLTKPAGHAAWRPGVS